MLFNSYTFLGVFLPFTLLGFAVARRAGLQAVIAFLVVASIVFYAYWNVAYLPLLLGSLAFNYAAGIWLARRGTGLPLAIAANLLLLGVFKYASLVVRTLQPVLELPDPKLELPLAISFFTFQQIGYVVQCARTRQANEDLGRYALFVTFFPQLIAGPIVTHDTLVEQTWKGWMERVPDRWHAGLALLVLGLFKKLALADHFAPIADTVFSGAGALDAVVAWRGTLAYALQIYFDFSGYSDMAMGLGLMFGLALPANFDAPYRAGSIIDFWRRWHITLSAFLRDYLYIPLGGNRHGPNRRWVNLMITMLLGGLWHGASWTFMGWGFMHGAFLGVNHAWRSLVGPDRMPRAIGVLITFVGVCFAWVLFRAEDIERSLAMWSAMVGLEGMGSPEATDLTLAAGLVVCTVAPVSWRWIQERTAGFSSLEAAGLGVAAALAVIHLNRVTPFLYFQF